MTLRFPLLALAAALALGGPAVIAQPAAPAAAEPWPQQASDVRADPDVRFGTLPNGMRYALRRNATPPGQTSLRLRIDAGSLHEQDDQRGLAHFIEHMAFNGTTHVPEGEFVRRLERHGLRFGPDTNASTDFTPDRLQARSAAQTTPRRSTLRSVPAPRSGRRGFVRARGDRRERGIIQSEERTRATPQYRIFARPVHLSAARPAAADRAGRSARPR